MAVGGNGKTPTARSSIRVQLLWCSAVVLICGPGIALAWVWMNIRSWSVAAVIAVAMFSGVVLGQEKQVQTTVNVGSISGRIVDRRGVPVRNRPVLLKAAKPPDTAVITSTNQDGGFTFPRVIPASYEIIPEVQGFKRLVVAVTVTGGSNVNVGNVVLEVAPIGDGFGEVTPYTAPVSQSSNAASEDDASGRQFRGRYANIDYGFSVEIPAQVVGEGTAAPAPNHGFAIEFDKKSVVWVDATYDVTGPSSFRTQTSSGSAPAPLPDQAGRALTPR